MKKTTTKKQQFLSGNIKFLEVKFSIYLNRRVFAMLFFRVDLFSDRNQYAGR